MDDFKIEQRIRGELSENFGDWNRVGKVCEDLIISEAVLTNAMLKAVRKASELDLMQRDKEELGLMPDIPAKAVRELLEAIVGHLNFALDYNIESRKK